MPLNTNIQGPTLKTLKTLKTRFLCFILPNVRRQSAVPVAQSMPGAKRLSMERDIYRSWLHRIVRLSFLSAFSSGLKTFPIAVPELGASRQLPSEHVFAYGQDQIS
jgi:hypothetical protein